MSRPSTFQEKVTLLNPNRNNLPKRNRFFTGREDILNQLNHVFSTNKGTAIVQVLSGLSGIGKTHTALEFCHLHINDYQTILWVNAENEVNLSSSYADIVRLLGLVTTGGLNSFNLQQNILSVNNWLSNHPNWLLVWDNLQDVTLLSEFFPSNHQGHILITTCQSLLEYSYIIDLPKMSIVTGVLLLLKKASLLPANKKTLELVSDEDISIAQKIVQEVDGLPLALSMVGCYLEQNKCSLTDYLSLYQNIKDSIFPSNVDNKDFNTNKCINNIYKLSIDKITQDNLIATQLLQTISVLPPSNIVEEIFTETTSLLGDELAGFTDSVSIYNNIIQLLSNYSLIERNNINQSICLHELLQKAIGESLDYNLKLSIVDKLTKALEYLASKDPQDPQYWPLYQRILPCSLALSEFINVLDVKSLESAKLFYQLGVYCQNQGLFNQSLDCYFLALTSYRHIFGDNHAWVAIILNNIGEVYRSQENYYLASNCYLESLGCYKEVFQENHPSIAMTLANLGILCAETARESEAIEYYKQALQSFEEFLPANHPWIIKIVRLYSKLLAQLNRDDEAQALLKRIEP